MGALSGVVEYQMLRTPFFKRPETSDSKLGCMGNYDDKNACYQRRIQHSLLASGNLSVDVTAGAKCCSQLTT